MIDNNSNMLQKVEEFLLKRYIHCDKRWLSDKIELFKSSPRIEEEIYKQLLITDINEFIDKNKHSTYTGLKDLNRADTKVKTLNKNIFLQVNEYTNIAQPSYKPKEALIDLLDKEKNVESKFLLSQEEQESQRIEKKVFKMTLTDGTDSIYAFEHEAIPGLTDVLANKFPKLIVLKDAEIRRGTIFLKTKHINLL
jgi:hypothetical protein